MYFLVLLVSLAADINVTPEMQLQVTDLSGVVEERQAETMEALLEGDKGMSKAVIADGVAVTTDDDMFDTVAANFGTEPLTLKQRNWLFTAGQHAFSNPAAVTGSLQRRVWDLTQVRVDRKTYRPGQQTVWTKEWFMLADLTLLAQAMGSLADVVKDLNSDEGEPTVTMDSVMDYQSPVLWYFRSTFNPVTEQTTLKFYRLWFTREATELSASYVGGAPGWTLFDPFDTPRLWASLDDSATHAPGFPGGAGIAEHSFYLFSKNVQGVRATMADTDVQAWAALLAQAANNINAFVSGQSGLFQTYHNRLDDALKAEFGNNFAAGGQADTPWFLDHEKALAAAQSQGYGAGKVITQDEVNRYMQMTADERTFYLNHVQKGDMDGDGWSDSFETKNGYNANDFFEKPTDSEMDGYADCLDIDIDSDGQPNRSDADDDGDGWSDGNEERNGTRAYDPNDFPSAISASGGNGNSTTPGAGTSNHGTTGGVGGAEAPVRPVLPETHGGTTAGAGAEPDAEEVQEGMVDMPDGIRFDDPAPGSVDEGQSSDWQPSEPIQNDDMHIELREQLPESEVPYRGELEENNPVDWGPGYQNGPDGTINNWGQDVYIDEKWLFGNSGRGYNTVDEIADGVEQGMGQALGELTDAPEVDGTGLPDVSEAVSGVGSGVGDALGGTGAGGVLDALEPTESLGWNPTIEIPWVNGVPMEFELLDLSLIPGVAAEYEVLRALVYWALVLAMFWVWMKAVLKLVGTTA